MVPRAVRKAAVKWTKWINPQPRKRTRGGRLISKEQERVFDEVRLERDRQDARWKVQNHHPLRWLAILGEESGEAAKAILEGSLLRYREELTHIAAVAVAAIEALDRSKGLRNDAEL